ncbi:MAG TPA: prolyl oligopeptidase family serine peptidase [Verrucomicrobiae bacterium]|nr:prolyl oligopeptidase family serine peptidase [Verrucomicrobiae bacterium]
MTLLRLAVPVAALAVAACGSSDPAAVTAHAPATGTLPTVSSGHRPGPDVLYAEPAVAPQLTNAGAWVAQPILVSGAVAYRNGEFLYQDFLHDDHGAAGTVDRSGPYNIGDFLFAPRAGTFTYPTDPAYAHNAADLVEFRVKPVADATAFRVTLNTLLDPSRVAFTVALGDGAATSWPHGAGVKSPATHFLTVYGAEAELRDAAGNVLAPAATATVDLSRRQFDVRVPRAAWDPGSGIVRMTIGVGLWDAASGAYLAPAAGAATATKPGGAGPLLTAIVNVGPRLDEPFPDVTQPAPPYTIGDAAAGAAAQAHWWRDRQQADALRLGDVSAFAAQVDFAKLAAGTGDESGVPQDGPMNRILASRHEFGQGLDTTKVCFDIPTSFEAGAACIGFFVGQLQPYALYVPPGKPVPDKGWGFTLLPHSLSANYNQYTASANQSQVGDQAQGYLVATPSGRGPDSFYAGMGEVDAFEVWADVARHYPIDSDRVTVTGYSMGGFGTYRLLSRWPDLFAAGFSVVGAMGAAEPMLAGLRNTPLMMWNASADELVNVEDAEAAAEAMAALGYRFIYWLFTSADHLTLATNDEYTPGAEFLAQFSIDRNPPHVSFVMNPAEDVPGVLVADHAYWVSDIVVRDPDAGVGSVEVRSEGFGVGDAPALAVAPGAGTLTGGSHGPMSYASRSLAWGEAPAAPVADVLHVTASNVASLTIDPHRARVTCGAQLDVTSDGPLTVTLAGC